MVARSARADLVAILGISPLSQIQLCGPAGVASGVACMTSPVPAAGPGTVPEPDTQFNFAEHLLKLNATRGDRAAFIDDLGTLNYAALAERVRRVASGLKALGVRREERVLLLMHDINDWPVAFLGAMHAGVVPVAVNTLLTADDYAYMLEHSRAQVAFVNGALLPTLSAALAAAPHEVTKLVVSRPTAPLRDGEVDFEAFVQSHAPSSHAVPTGPDAPGFWLYSSGSTGRPKGTVHTHANPYWTSELYGKHCLRLGERDVCFSAAKLFFAYGLGNALTFPMSVGATTILMAERPTPDAVFKRWLGQVGGVKPTVFFGAPTGYAGMLAAPTLPGRQDVALRMASSAGEALPADIGERFKRHFGIDVVDGIGSTEMLHIFLSNTPDAVRYGTTGWPVPGYEVKLVGEDGGNVADGEPGDLYIRGPSAALMYWGNRDKTRDTFQGAWTKSGDKYVRNTDGTYTYSGRSDDMLKVSGIYVSPFEVEATLVQHPAVLEAAVIGKEDGDGLTRSKAFVVLKSGQSTDEAALKAFVKDRLAPYKYPRFIEFVSELPKTATGKIQRFKLRDLEKSR
jgi:benzoate-CoA ligase